MSNRKAKLKTLLEKWPRFANDEQRKLVYSRDAGKCQYCDKNLGLNQAMFDHVIPWPEGATHVDNLVVCCGYCNKKKSKWFIPISERPIPGVCWTSPPPQKVVRFYQNQQFYTNKRIIILYSAFETNRSKH